MPKIGCRECDSPDCKGCNIYTLERALKAGKFDWMKNGNNAIVVPETPPEGVHLKLEPSDCRNAAEFIEWEFFNHLKNLLDVDDLDNIDYLRSLIRVLDEMERVGKEDHDGK